jgi:hypothetical protein
MQMEAMTSPLSSRPERSVVEGSAVRPSNSPNSAALTQTLYPLRLFSLELRADFAVAGAEALTILPGGGTTEVVP